MLYHHTPAVTEASFWGRPRTFKSGLLNQIEDVLYRQNDRPGVYQCALNFAHRLYCGRCPLSANVANIEIPYPPPISQWHREQQTKYANRIDPGVEVGLVPVCWFCDRCLPLTARSNYRDSSTSIRSVSVSHVKCLYAYVDKYVA